MRTEPLNTSQSSSDSGNRLQQIDALRGIAALLVLVSHASSGLASYATHFGHTDALYRFAQSVDFGRIGVMVFFIISGFVVASTLNATGANLSKFAVRRIFRLYPLFWFSVILVIFFLQGKNELIQLVTDAQSIAMNFTMLPTLLGSESLMIIYWTLETELVFYLAAAAVYRSGYLFHPMGLFILITALIGVFAAVMFGALPSPSNLAWKSLSLNLAFMFWGSLFYSVFSESAVKSRLIEKRHLAILGAAVILSPSFYTWYRFLSSGSPDDFRWAVAYPSALVIFAAIFFIKARWIRLTSKFGLISYSMYLLHPAAIIMVVVFLDHYRIAPEFGHLPLLTFVAIGLAIVMSMVAYQVIEKPFISIGRRLTRKSSQAV
jgi:peptidoglycan/LPS O-acetylase OafA/YrhL